MTLLRLEGVGFTTGDRTLLRDVSTTVAGGDLVGLVGANGAGKSTLLRRISGFYRTGNGSVLLNDQPIDRYSDRDRARLIATVPQVTSIESMIPAIDLVLQGRHPHLGRFALEGATDRAIADIAMTSAGVSHLAHRLVPTLSGGERQRVLIARALAQEPKLLLLDEPTASLDLRHQIDILAMVRRLADQGLAVIAAMHDLSLAARVCNRMIVLHEGQVLADGTPEEVLTPSILERAFDVRAVIAPGPLTGTPEIAAVAPIHTPGEELGRVHIIAGGGRAARVIGMLAEAGYTLSTSVLGEGDTDLMAARLAGAETITHPSFAPVNDDNDRKHRALIEQADCVVVTDVSWGMSNTRNLEAVQDARQVIVVDGVPVDRRDYSGGRAGAILAEIDARAIHVSLETLVDTVRNLIRVQHAAGQPTGVREKNG